MEYSIKIPEKYVRLLRKNNEKLKKHFEKITGVKLNIRGNEIMYATDDPVLGFALQRVLRAFGRGFSMDDALNLLDDEYGLEIIDITAFSGRSKNRLRELKGRVIGRDGKAKRTIENLTNTKIAVSGKTVSILGKWEDVYRARHAIEMLLQGAMHKTVYRWLETVG